MPIDNTNPTGGLSIEELNKRFQAAQEEKKSNYGSNMDDFIAQQSASGHKPNYASVANRWADYKVTMPTSNVDQAVMPDKEYGIGDWDYAQANKTDKLGPDGQSLPPGAVGWTADVEPWYGTKYAITEWAKGFANNVFKDSGQKYQEWINKRFTTTGQEYKDYMDSIGGERPENEQTGLKNISRFVGQTIGGLLTLLDIPARATKRVVATGDILEEVAQESDIKDIEPLVDVYENLGTASQDKTKSPFARGASGIFKNLLEAFDVINIGWDGIRAASVLFSNDDKKKASGWATLNEEWNAGRIAYTNWLEPATKEEFIRRLNNGESEYLLQEELRNPWMDLAGSLLLDPLNFVGVLTKGSKTAKIVKNSKTGILAGIADDLVRQAENVTDFTKMENVAEDFAHTVINVRENQIADLRKLATKETIVSLTTSGRRAHSEEVVTEFLGTLSANIGQLPGRTVGVRQIDETMQVLDNILKLSSPDIAEVKSAVVALGSYAGQGIPYELLYGNGALQTSYILREMANVDDLKKLEKLITGTENVVDNIGDFVKALDKKVSSGTAKLFPTLAERVESGEELTSFGQAMLRVENFANSGPMREVNKFFAHVYMGMSPGYAARNLITNTLHIIADEGFGVFKTGNTVDLFSIKNKESNIEKMLGYIPEAAKRSLGPVGEYKDASWFSKTFGIGLELGRKAEERSSLRVFNAATERVFKSMLKPGRAIPDTAPLIQAGLSAEAANQLQNYMVLARGNVGEAMKLFRGDIANGSMDLFRSMGWLDNTAELNSLERLGIDGSTKDILREISERADGSIDDANKAVDDIFDAIEKEMETVTKEAGGYTAGGHHMETIQDAIEYGNMSADEISEFSSKMQANLDADNAYKVVVGRLNTLLKNHPQIDIDSALTGHPLERYLRGFMNNEFWPQAQELARAENRSLIAYSKEVHANKWTDGGALWKRMNLPGNAPANITPQQVIDYAWDGYLRPWMRNYWQNVRESNAHLTEELANTIYGAIPDEIVGDQNLYKYIQSIDEQMQQAQMYLDYAQVWDKGERLNGVNFMLNNADIAKNDDMVRLMSLNMKEGASEFGVKPYMNNILRQRVEEYPDILARVVDKNPNKVFRVGENEFGPDMYAFLNNIQTHPKEYTVSDLNDVIDELANGNWKSIPINKSNNKTQKLQWLSDTLDDFVEQGKKVNKKDITFNDFDYEDVRKILGDHFGGDFVDFEKLDGTSKMYMRNLIDDMAGKTGEYMKIATPELADMPVSQGRGFYNMKEEVTWLRDALKKKVSNNWGKRGQLTFNDGIEEALTGWTAEAINRTTKMRMTATEVASAQRDFALLNYGERNNFDTILSLIYPYGFWYSRTYPNWLRRAAQNPGLIAAYAKYRGTLEDIHAGQPDWWKYNVNTNELFGLNSENPLFFNLEATLNPLYGLTGVDFEDRYKLVNGWTQTLNDMNRFGPSTHTLFSVATALSLWKQGETDAAQRWAGRLIPATQTVSAISASLGFGVNEFDPFVLLFDNGVDPYTARRVQRALAQMQIEGMITEEEAIDAARSKTGDIWDIAHERAVTERAPGQISSFFLGVGFKARSMADLATDQMYQDYFRILSMREILSPDEFRIQLDKLHEQYPMMNTVLISDDSEYAYNVLGRIPPGQSSEFYEMAGVSKEVVSQFYEMKGDMTDWSEGDRSRFMAAIVDLGAVLAIPENATRQEWTSASNAYKELTREIEGIWGTEIQDKIDTYYAIYRENKDFAREYLDLNPAVSEAMDYRAGVIAMNPTGVLATYYGGIEQISNYYKGEMYDEAERVFTDEIFATEANYWSFSASSDRKAYLSQHPELKEYWDFKNEYNVMINEHTIALGSLLQEPQGIEYRDDIQGLGIGATQLIEATQNNADPFANVTIEQWVSYVGEEVVDVAIDAVRNARQLSYREREMLTSAAENVGLDSYNELIQRIGIADAQDLSTLPVQQP